MPLHDLDHVTLLRAYEAAANRHDIEDCVALFAGDGVIEDHGRTARGTDRIREAHEYERACAGQMAIIESVSDGNEVRCHIVYRNEIDRLLDLDGVRKSARFVFQDGSIDSVILDGADDASNDRHQRAFTPFRTWARMYHPEAYGRMHAYDGPAGTVLVVLARAWVDAGRPVGE